jgi:flagellar basal-body rod protein FlgB
VGIFDVTQIALERALSGATLRQQTIANNIANANTAGFKRADVDFKSALADAFGSGASGHELESVTFKTATDNQTSSRADGNNVDIDQEMANLSENTLDYQALIAVSRARVSMLQTVLGTGR